ncbi:hypothetical protein IF2G_02364 [Cordyceps javanica]|nr:hypothetical protein IF2G_02364 [Cordyceps javanica]
MSKDYRVHTSHGLGNPGLAAHDWVPYCSEIELHRETQAATLVDRPLQKTALDTTTSTGSQVPGCWDVDSRTARLSPVSTVYTLLFSPFTEY